jgi:DUF4097 and DUF4098 domain-containing protein YvlB
LALAFIVLPAGVLLAAENGNRAEKSLQAIPNPRISISNPTRGKVTVRGWDRAQVHAVYSTSSSKAAVEVDQVPPTGEAEKVHFVTNVLDPQASAQDKTASYELDVPVGSSIRIYNPEGSVTVQRISGDEDVDSVNGKVEVDDASGHVSVRSINGDIDFVRPGGRVEATSVMGNLHFTGSSSSNVRGQTESGKIVFDGDFAPNGDYVLKSWRGDMDVACSPSDSFELSARTVTGKVDIQVHLSKRGRAAGAHGEGLFGYSNQGSATVELKSYSGTIHVRPR